MMGEIQNLIDKIFVKTIIKTIKKPVIGFNGSPVQSHIYVENCVELMRHMKPGIIDFCITSPPYGNLREYHGYEFDTEKIGKGLYKVMSNDGVLVWVVGDQTNDGDEQGIPYQHALMFKKIGFKLYDTMIYEKLNYAPFNHRRYEQCFEFMFVFCKSKPKVFNPLRVDCSYAGDQPSPTFYVHNKLNEPTPRNEKEFIVEETKIKKNIWSYNVGYRRNKVHETKGHPAPFPEQLVEDHMLTWTERGNLVFDPMMGSGTTGVIAKKLDRHFIGCEISKKYCELALDRMNTYL